MTGYDETGPSGTGLDHAPTTVDDTGRRGKVTQLALWMARRSFCDRLAAERAPYASHLDRLKALEAAGLVNDETRMPS